MGYCIANGDYEGKEDFCWLDKGRPELCWIDELPEKKELCDFWIPHNPSVEADAETAPRRSL